jgi:hypothetical protein
VQRVRHLTHTWGGGEVWHVCAAGAGGAEQWQGEDEGCAA